MQTQCLKVLLFVCTAIALLRSVSAQSADKPPHSPAPSDPAGSTARPTNLKALSKDLPSEDIRTLMHSYTRAIGAPCGYCHEENAQTKSLDFASDANPMKETARLMIRMTNDINNRYLAQLGDRRYAEPLTCGNCHQGHPSPPTFEPKP